MDFRVYKVGVTTIYAYNIKDELVLKESSNALEWCSEDDFHQWQFIANERRRAEFLAVRYILWRIGLQNHFYYDGRIPKLLNGEQISISHSHDWVVVMLCKDFVIGVDVELIRDKVMRVHDKFVHESERDIFPKTNLELSTLLWSFKETVYKLMRVEGLLFGEEIRVTSDENGNYKATVFAPQGIFEVPLGHQILENYVLTFNTGDAKRQA